ncbi:MAG: hypothetical protein AAF639_44435 [Chloroflexota bacterium]
MSRIRNYLHPNLSASGPHSIFYRDPHTGIITRYATYQHQTNSHNPAPWVLVKRYDGIGAAHYNKATGKLIKTPHVHDPNATGGVRAATDDEIPAQV